MSNRIQIAIKSDDLKNKIADKVKETGLTDSQLVYMIVNKYFYTVECQHEWTTIGIGSQSNLSEAICHKCGARPSAIKTMR